MDRLAEVFFFGYNNRLALVGKTSMASSFRTATLLDGLAGSARLILVIAFLIDLFDL